MTHCSKRSRAVGREVELKLEVPASAIDDVARLPWLSELSSGMPKCQKLVSVYFDTAKSKLREHGLGGPELRMSPIGWPVRLPSPIWRNPSRNAAMRSAPAKQRNLFVPARSNSIPRYRRRRHSRSSHCLVLIMPQ